MLRIYNVLAMAARWHRAEFNTLFLEMILEDIIVERLIELNVLRRPKRCNPVSLKLLNRFLNCGLFNDGTH